MSAFIKILVPIDFSPHSLAAAQYAATISRDLSASVVLAHVVTPIRLFPHGSPVNIPEIASTQRQVAEGELDRVFRETFGGRSNIEIVVTFGDVHAELLRIAAEKNADLVVMGTRGRRNPGRWFLGSTTESILRSVHAPILTVSHGDQARPPAAKFSRILYATDFSESSSALEVLSAKLAKAFDASLTVMNVIEYHDFILWAGTLVQLKDSDRTTIVDDTRKRLDELVKPWKTEGLKIETVVTEGKPYQKILEYADTHDVDLIVLNLQGKSMIERAALGSTAERVVRLANVPVLSVPVRA
jgi:nucleotide-binding universal stress UspA family protein